MAFWGIEVKAGKPFTHHFDRAKGRLHVSMASLGLGKAMAKSILECNVGNKGPVFLCSLHPENTESVQLNLEFEEVEQVVFSVIGPRPIHLSGYYLGGSRYRTLNQEESESYGEDIADTDSQTSDYSDEEYDDSFMDDGEPQVFPPSPSSIGEEGSFDTKKPKKGKGNRGRRRLRKKFRQLSDSDDDAYSRPKSTAKGSSAILGLESEDEDNIPISSHLKVGKTAKKDIQDGEENANMDNDEVGLPTSREPNLPVDRLLPFEMGHGYGGTPKKRKERLAEGESRESEESKQDQTQQGEAIVEGNSLNLMEEYSDKKKIVNDSDLAYENDESPKKKRKEQNNEKKNVKENKILQDEAKDVSILQDSSVRSVENQNNKFANDENHSGEKQLKEKKKKKKKKKTTTCQDT